MVTHDTRTDSYGNRVLYMEDGKIIDELSFADSDTMSFAEREKEIASWLSAMRW